MKGARVLIAALVVWAGVSDLPARGAHAPSSPLPRSERGSKGRVRGSSTSAAESAPITFNGDRAFSDLKRLVDFGPRPPGSKALSAARQWMIRELKQDGCDVQEDSFTASTPVGPIPMTNLICKIAGARPAVVMVAGHYDTKLDTAARFVGANDGGSSAAFLLELARDLGHRRNPLTYWLVFFDGEEALKEWSDTDSVYGSRDLLEKLTASGELGRIKAMILVDMIADAKLDIHREYNSTAWLQDVIFDEARRMGYSKEFLDEVRAYDDDHIPWVNAGVSAVDLLDLDYGPRGGGHPNGAYWHTPEDTVEHCSAASLGIVGRVVTAALGDLEKSAKTQ